MEENKLDSNLSSFSEVIEYSEFQEFFIYLYCFSYVILNFSSYYFELLPYFYQEVVILIVFFIIFISFYISYLKFS